MRDDDTDKPRPVCRPTRQSCIQTTYIIECTINRHRQ